MTKYSRVVAAAGAVVLALCGCAAQHPQATPETHTRPSPTQTPGWAFCDAFVPGMSDYASYIVETARGKFSSIDHATERIYISKMRTAAPVSMRSLTDDYASPFDEIDKVYEAGGGSLSFNSDAYKASILPLMTYCSGVGYKIPKS